MVQFFIVVINNALDPFKEGVFVTLESWGHGVSRMVFLESYKRMNEKGFVLGNSDSNIITTVLSFFPQKRGKPDHGRIEKENSFSHTLEKVYEVIRSSDMCQFM